jgi:FeS assembly protein IscX
MRQFLTWNDTFEIAVALSKRMPQVNLQNVSLGDILTWTKSLPEFMDSTELVTDQILNDIFREWLEEDITK